MKLFIRNLNFRNILDYKIRKEKHNSIELIKKERDGSYT